MPGFAKDQIKVSDDLTKKKRRTKSHSSFFFSPRQLDVADDTLTITAETSSDVEKDETDKDEVKYHIRERTAGGENTTTTTLHTDSIFTL